MQCSLFVQVGARLSIPGPRITYYNRPIYLPSQTASVLRNLQALQVGILGGLYLISHIVSLCRFRIFHTCFVNLLRRLISTNNSKHDLCWCQWNYSQWLPRRQWWSLCLSDFRWELGSARCCQLGFSAMFCSRAIYSVCSCWQVQKLDRPQYE